MIDTSNRLAEEQQIIQITDYYAHKIAAPQSWAKVFFSDICQIVGGSQPAKELFINEPRDGYIRLIQIRDYKTDKFATYIPIELAKRFCNKEEIMIGRYGPPIFQILRGLEGAYNVALMKAIPNVELIDKEFLYYFLQTPNLFNYVAAASLRTAGQDGVRREHLDNYPLFIPLLNEQRRIVAKIEALKARSQRVKEALEDIPQLLDQFRQSVLAAAFRGDLTADWREQNNQECLDYDFPSTWKKAELGDVIEGLKQGWSPKCEIFPSSSNDVWGVIKTTAVQSLHFIEGENKQLPSHLKPRPELELFEGDLLITRAGPRARAGVTCLVSSVRPKLMFCDKVYRFRAKELHILSLYLAYFLNSSSAISLIDELKTGISDSGVNLTQEKFLALPLWLPPIAEQQEIINRVKTLFKTTKDIEQQYQEAKANLDQLDQSILAKAFRGELVPQDPNDEPASVLLERIRAQRDKLQTKAAKKSTPPTGGRRSKKASQQEAEPVQLELGLE